MLKLVNDWYHRHFNDPQVAILALLLVISATILYFIQALDLYTDLIVGDLREPLQGCSACYDLILAADVFVYIGKLDEIIRACSEALKTGGILAFSVEFLQDEKEYILHPGGRYAHSQGYIQKTAEDAGLSASAIKHLVLRKEKGKPVEGLVFVLEKQA